MNESLLNKAMSSAQFRAENLSKFQAVSWALTDGIKVIHCHAALAKDAGQELVRSIHDYKNFATGFYLSIDPNNHLFDLNKLLDSIDDSSIDYWVIEGLTDNRREVKTFEQWRKNWRGKVHFIQTEYNNKRCQVISHITDSIYPWNISISCASITGNDHAITHAYQRFGIISELTNIVLECDIILCSTDQKSALDALPTHNKYNKPIEILLIENNAQIEPLLRYIKERKSYVTLSLCNHSMRQYLIERNLTHEIRHHVLLIESDEENTHTAKNINICSTDDWIIYNSHLVDNCCRIEMMKKNENTKDLQRRFN